MSVFASPREGPSTQAQPALRAKGFNEGQNRPYTADDFRSVQKGGRVYAFALAWPENGRLTIKSLAAGSPHAPGTVERVTLFGAPDALQHTRDGEGLHVMLPERRRGDYVYTLEISGNGLTKG